MPNVSIGQIEPVPEEVGFLGSQKYGAIDTLARKVASALSAPAPKKLNPAYDPNDPLNIANQIAENEKHVNVLAWRPDLKSPGKLETLPIGWNEQARRVDRLSALSMDDLRTHAEALRDAQALGYSYPKEVANPEFLAALALREGRGDYGNNTLNFYGLSNKTAKGIFNELQKRGTDDRAAGFAAMMYEKAQDAKRLNKPFTEVWNGTGTFKDPHTGKVGGGKYYAKNFDAFRTAALHPKNASLVGLIKGSLMPEPGYKRGGAIENTTHNRKIL